MDQEKPEPKISLPEAIYVGLFILTADALEAGLLFFGLDDFGISDVIAFPAIGIYLKMKGVKQTYSLIGNIIELIPYAGWLPLRTIGFVATAIADHNPKIVGMAKKVVGAAGVVAATAATGGAVAPAAAGAVAGEGAAAGGAATAAGAATATETGATAAAGVEVAPAAAVTEEAAGTGGEAAAQAKPAPEVSEQEFGVEKEPIEKLQELMEKIPEAEGEKEEEGEEEPTAPAIDNEEDNELL